jgi:hypothetical protein
MPDSRRQTLVNAVRDRFTTIRVAAGYETDLGASVHVWRDTNTNPFTPQELATGGLNLRDPKRETNQELVNKHQHTLSINCEIAVAAADTVRKMLADLDKAIGVDRKWGGVAFDTDPGDDSILVAQNGTLITGASYNFTILYRTGSFDPYNA